MKLKTLLVEVKQQVSASVSTGDFSKLFTKLPKVVENARAKMDIVDNKWPDKKLIMVATALTRQIDSNQSDELVDEWNDLTDEEQIEHAKKAIEKYLEENKG